MIWHETKTAVGVRPALDPPAADERIYPMTTIRQKRHGGNPNSDLFTSEPDPSTGPPRECELCHGMTTTRKLGLAWCPTCEYGWIDADEIPVRVKQRGPDPNAPNPFSAVYGAIPSCRKRVGRG